MTAGAALGPEAALGDCLLSVSTYPGGDFTSSNSTYCKKKWCQQPNRSYNGLLDCFVCQRLYRCAQLEHAIPTVPMDWLEHRNTLTERLHRVLEMASGTKAPNRDTLVEAAVDAADQQQLQQHVNLTNDSNKLSHMLVWERAAVAGQQVAEDRVWH